jgi:hypothetical protein
MERNFVSAGEGWVHFMPLSLLNVRLQKAFRQALHAAIAMS